MSNEMWDCLWLGADLITMEPDAKSEGSLGIIRGGALGVQAGRIAYCGPSADLAGRPEELAQTVVRLTGGFILPGLIDCHTHLVFGGNRAAEFEMRLHGASYEEISEQGGGIRSTVAATRAAPLEELISTGAARASRLMSEGVTTVEIKSGYGLTLPDELKMLRAARAIGDEIGVDVVPTFLGAHTVPEEFAGHADRYVDLICEEMLPEIATSGLTQAVDGFCETIAFLPAEIERVFGVAQDLGLRVKLHADQLSDLGGAELAASFDALSADHLEYTSQRGVEKMAAAGTVGVLLPGAFYSLGETQKPPVDLLRANDVPIAIATDCNPGSSPVSSLQLVMNMSCTLFNLTTDEALLAVTKNAAKALGLYEDRGSLAVGKRADFAHWRLERPAELCYWVDALVPDFVVRQGELAG